MNSKKKTLPFALLLLTAFASAVSCTRTPAELPETEIINYTSSERDGWEFYSESFSFTEKVNPDYDKSKTVERTGYRVMMKNATTGDEKCPCMLPLCDHTIGSDCPMVSRFEILNTIVSGERLLVYSCGNYYPLTQADAIDVTKRGFSSELKVFNLVTGECDTVFSYIANYTSTDYLLGDRYIWFILPDVVDMKTVFMLKRYDMENGKVTGLYSFETNHAFHFLTDSRIYLANFPASATSPDDLDVISLNYDGTGLREEQPFLAYPALFRDDFLLAREPLESPGSGLMCFTPRCVYYNVATREYHDFSDGENMNVVGFRETDGRIYYISSEKAETAFTLNPFTRSAELGMTVEEFYGCEEERMRMYDEIEDAYFNDVMYLKSRKADGSEPVTHFAFPRGLYFDILTDSRYFNSSTGSVSRDGRYFYVVVLSLSDGAEVRRRAAIDIETGELLDMPASEANEQFPW